MRHRNTHLLAAVILTIHCLTAPAEAQNTNEALPHQHLGVTTADLIERLQGGGHVLVIRHERTDAFRPDSPELDVENCATQRNLSVAGHANAIENGRVIHHMKIPVERVLASPVCRTLETGRLMFGDVEAETALWGYGQDHDEVRAAFTQLALEGAGQTGNTALVTHLGTYSATFGGHIAEGDAAVFTVVNNEPELLGVIAANAWNDAIIDATLTPHHGEEHSHEHH